MAMTRARSSGSCNLPKWSMPAATSSKRHRPAAAAAPAESPVLEVPHRPAPLREVGGQLVLEAQLVARPPESTVDQDRHRMRRSATRGQRQLAELVAMRAVGVRANGDVPTLHSGPLPGA